MLLFAKSKIDQLVNKVEELTIKRQAVEDKGKEKNSNIENSIQRLENKAFRNKVRTDNQLANIDRELAKAKEQIKLEKKYYSTIGE